MTEDFSNAVWKALGEGAEAENGETHGSVTRLGTARHGPRRTPRGGASAGHADARACAQCKLRAINICGARRALVLVLKGVARTEEEQGHILHAARVRVAMPSVIRLLEYRRIPHQTRALSRKNILLRDRNCCQYCSVVLTAGELTLDHVIPRSRGGLSTWENLVACCPTCNRRKGNQMLHELTEMKLQREPKPFSLHTSRHIMRMIGSADPSWRRYLYFESGEAA